MNIQRKKVRMKSKIGRIEMIVSPVVVLAAMGLVFLWCCPEWHWHPEMLVEHWQYKRQLCWNGIGIMTFCMPLLAGWRRWLKLAPVMAAVWLVMFAASKFSPSDGGGWFVTLGPIRFDLLGMLPFALAMTLAWIANRFRFRAVRMLLVVAGTILIALTMRMATNANRVSRIAEWFSSSPPTKVLSEDGSSLARAWAQMACVKAVEASRWFSANEEHLKDNPIPGRFTSAMPASAALVFGKWFLVLFGAAFGFLGWCFARAWFATADQGKKAFLAVAGLGTIVPAALSTFECLGLTPMMYTCVPLVSYGGTAAMMTWLIAGTLASVLLDGNVDALREHDTRLCTSGCGNIKHLER